MFDASIYSEAFYNKEDLSRYQTADIVLTEFFKYYQPESVVDFGCGLGHWLSVCLDKGIKEIRGYDGHYVDADALKIPHEFFERHNLEAPLVIKRKYDLALTIEVAEHLPEDKADSFIQSLTDSADVVLFSAAAPYQGGINHFNENSPAYWTRIFNKKGFLCFDFMRDILWEKKGVNCVHAQNILVFVKKESRHLIEREGLAPVLSPRLMYHPEFVKIKLDVPVSKPVDVVRKKRFLYYLLFIPLSLIPSKKKRNEMRDWKKK
mgnify:FL=1